MPRFPIERLGVATAALLLAAGCASPQPATTSAVATPSPETTTAPAGTPSAAGQFAQNLTFTGPASGVITQAVTTCRIVGSTRQFTADLQSDLSGKRLTFTITVFKDFKGAGSYPVGSLTDGGSSLTMSWGTYTGASSGGAGSNVVGADAKSGTIAATLNDGEHVVGTWACAAVTPP